MYRAYLMIMMIASASVAHAQLYKLHLSSSDNKTIRQWANDQPSSRDSMSWILERSLLLRSLHDEGYLMAEVNQWVYSDDSLIASVDPGPAIHWADLSFRALEFLPPQWVAQLDESGEIVNYKNWRSNVEQVLQSAQSDGYLFASYDLEVRALKNDSLYAEIVFDPGLKIILDSIDNKGTARLSSQFLYRTLGIRKGDPVTPEHLKSLQQQLNNLRFVHQTSPPVLILIDEKATVRAYLDNRNASSFDILAGFQPSNDPGKSFSLTGYAELDLVNQLTRGERIFLHLEKLRPRSQELEMALSYPFLLDLPFGVEGDFRLLKNDTLYSELEWKAGISMPLGKNQFIRAGVTQLSTNIIGVDINRVLSTKRLPPYVDIRIKGFTLGLLRNRLDFDLNPRRGYSVDIEGSFSQRRVRPNDLITRLNEVDTLFDYAALYDTLSEPSSRIVLEAALQYFIPWGNRSTIRLAVDAGGIESGKRLFSNELFRLGGYARLRGFDEESILAQFYSIFSAEYRLIIGGGSYISLFGDYAWIRNEDVDLPLEDRPFGLGFGLNLETTAGIFGMRIAVGAQRGNAIDLDNTRVHLGYVNRF